MDRRGCESSEEQRDEHNRQGPQESVPDARGGWLHWRLTHCGNEAIAATGHRFYGSLQATQREHPAQAVDILNQVRLLNELIRPEPIHELVFSDELTRAFDQGRQSLDNFWPERDRLAVPQEEPPLRVERERADVDEVFHVRFLV
jgi:hypothetical protein